MCSEKLTDCQRVRMRMESLAYVMREYRGTHTFWTAYMRLNDLALVYRNLRGDA